MFYVLGQYRKEITTSPAYTNTILAGHGDHGAAIVLKNRLEGHGVSQGNENGMITSEKESQV